MSNKIRILVVEPNKEPYQKKIEHSLKNLQKTVNGYIEVLQLEHNVDIICNEEGKINGLPFNKVVDYDIIVGTFIIAGHNDSETISLSRKQIKKYKEMFKLSKHNQYINYLFRHSRDEKFLRDIDKVGILKAIKRNIRKDII